MTLQEFRASRKLMTMADVETEFPDIVESMQYGSEYTHAHVYSGGLYILASRRGFYLHLECDEYETRDLPLLEFLLWQYGFDTPETQALCGIIWG